MPIYEYECQSCREVIEKWQSLSDQPLSSCPSCSGVLKKLISQSSFQLKGGGWYADSYGGSSVAKSCPAGDSAPCGSSTDSASAGCGKNTSCSCG